MALLENESTTVQALLDQATTGDQEALTALFTQHRDRLRRMVWLRLNRRLAGRLDPSDVVQEALVQASRDLPIYLREPPLPFFPWLRRLVMQKLADMHRRHLGARRRDAGREIPFNGDMPPASAALAIEPQGDLTGPCEAAQRTESQLSLRQALEQLEPLDREVLELRHFEQLTNGEAAGVLKIAETTASKRYVRALERVAAALRRPSPNS